MSRKAKYLVNSILDEDPNLMIDEIYQLFDPGDEIYIASKSLNSIEISFIFFEEDKCKALLEACEKMGTLINYKDFTYEFLNGNYDKITDFDIVFIEEFNISVLNNYLEEELDIDMILDKIIERGINSLTTFEKRILEKNNES